MQQDPSSRENWNTRLKQQRVGTVTKFSNLVVPLRQTFISYDVSAIFTSILIDKAVDMVRNRLQTDVVDLHALCLGTTYCVRRQVIRTNARHCYGFTCHLYYLQNLQGRFEDNVLSSLYNTNFRWYAHVNTSNSVRIWAPFWGCVLCQICKIFCGLQTYFN